MQTIDFPTADPVPTRLGWLSRVGGGGGGGGGGGVRLVLYFRQKSESASETLLGFRHFHTQPDFYLFIYFLKICVLIKVQNGVVVKKL